MFFMKIIPDPTLISKILPPIIVDNLRCVPTGTKTSGLLLHAVKRHVEIYLSLSTRPIWSDLVAKRAADFSRFDVDVRWPTARRMASDADWPDCFAPTPESARSSLLSRALFRMLGSTVFSCPLNLLWSRESTTHGLLGCMSRIWEHKTQKQRRVIRMWFQDESSSRSWSEQVTWVIASWTGHYIVTIGVLCPGEIPSWHYRMAWIAARAPKRGAWRIQRRKADRQRAASHIFRWIRRDGCRTNATVGVAAAWHVPRPATVKEQRRCTSEVNGPFNLPILFILMRWTTSPCKLLSAAIDLPDRFENCSTRKKKRGGGGERKEGQLPRVRKSNRFHSSLQWSTVLYIGGKILAIGSLNGCHKSKWWVCMEYLFEIQYKHFPFDFGDI